jgi:hypothetical protein
MTSRGKSTVSPLLGFWLVIAVINILLCYFGYQAVRKCAGVDGDQASPSQDSEGNLNGMEDDQCVNDVEDDRNRNVRRQTGNDDDDAGLYRSGGGENSLDRRHDDLDDRRGRSVETNLSEGETNLSEGDRIWLDSVNPHLEDRESDSYSYSTYSSGSQSESGTPALVSFILSL